MPARYAVSLRYAVPLAWVCASLAVGGCSSGGGGDDGAAGSAPSWSFLTPSAQGVSTGPSATPGPLGAPTGRVTPTPSDPVPPAPSPAATRALGDLLLPVPAAYRVHRRARVTLAATAYARLVGGDARLATDLLDAGVRGVHLTDGRDGDGTLARVALLATAHESVASVVAARLAGGGGDTTRAREVAGLGRLLVTTRRAGAGEPGRCVDVAVVVEAAVVRASGCSARLPSSRLEALATVLAARQASALR